MSQTNYIIFIISAAFFLSCSRPGNDLKEIETLPPIFPDYCDVVIPVNIAPLNFKICDYPEKTDALIEGAKESIKIHGKDKVIIPEYKWKRLLRNNTNGRLSITVYARRDGRGINTSLSISASGASLPTRSLYTVLLHQGMKLGPKWGYISATLPVLIRTR